MEPSSEILKLLTEIRDSQRELVALTKAGQEKNQAQYREWQEESAKTKPAFALWEEANKVWLRQYSAPTLNVIGVVLLLIMGSVVGFLIAMAWLK